MRQRIPGLALLVGPLFLLASTLAASADIVLIKNGDRISGEVVEVTDGELVISTEYAGTLRIAWAKIEVIQTDEDVRIRLDDDTVVRGRILATEDGKLKLQEEGKPAPHEVPKDRVVRLNQPGVFWHGSVAISGKAENGNSVSKDIFLRAEIVMETENTRTSLRGNYARETDDEVLSEDNYYALLKFDLHLSLTSFGYVSNESRRDKFEDLQYRNVASAGLGYTFFKTETFNVWVEAGPAFMSEELSDGTTDSWFGGRGGVHFSLELPLGLEIRDDFVVWPNFEDWNNWQIHNELILSTRILRGVQVSLSIITDLDNEPSLGREKTDNKFLLGLGHKF